MPIESGVGKVEIISGAVLSTGPPPGALLDAQPNEIVKSKKTQNYIFVLKHPRNLG